MYSPKILQSEFQSLVGVRQPSIANIPQLTGWITESNTGIYVDDKHPLASTENMYYSSPNFQPSTFPAWVSGNNYAKGIPTNDGGNIYISLNALTNDTVKPSLDSTNWSPYNPFNNWIEQKYNQASSNFMQQVIVRKKLTHMAKAILERQQLYRGSGSTFQKIVGQQRFVGFQITPQQAEALWVFIDMIGIQLSAPQNLTFYLYSSEVYAPLGEWTINISAQSTFSWNQLLEGSPLPWVSGSNYPTIGTVVFVGSLFYKSLNTLTSDVISPGSDPTNWVSIPKPSLNCIMKYLSQNTSGTYYFGYYEQDLVGQALSKSWNCNTFPCLGCDGIDVTWYNQWSRYTTFRNISVPLSGQTIGRNLFDLNQITFDNVTNWGMNFSLTVRCNITDFVIYSKDLFADAFATQVCKEFLEAIANGCRIGSNPAQTKLSAIAALDEKSPGNWITKKGGYYDVIDALNLDMSGFSNACMSSNDMKKKISFFSI